ncbi:hypothetical protein BGZ65_010085, partial [Modicella reniformis]
MSAPLIDALVKTKNIEQPSLANTFGQSAEPFLIPQMPKVFELYSDKIVPIREAAGVASKAVMSLPTRYAVRLLLPVIFHAIKESK